MQVVEGYETGPLKREPLWDPENTRASVPVFICEIHSMLFMCCELIHVLLCICVLADGLSGSYPTLWLCEGRESGAEAFVNVNQFNYKYSQGLRKKTSIFKCCPYFKVIVQISSGWVLWNVFGPLNNFGLAKQSLFFLDWHFGVISYWNVIVGD